MVVDLTVGCYGNLMALIADGWHMATHAGAMALTLFGYWFARKYDEDPRFSFGTGKVFALTGFASAIALAIAGFLVAGESMHHMLHPEQIDFDIAMVIAVVGLVVNLISAWLLGNDEVAESSHSHSHSHGHSHDHNLRGAYMHVLADALTSVLAIISLAFGKWFGWVILDPIIGVLGGIIIIKWAISLVRDTAWVLLDAQDSTELMESVYTCIAKEENTWIVDLHIWDLGLGRRACVLSVVSRNPKSPEFYKMKLGELATFFHVNVEVFLFDDSNVSHDGFSADGHSHHHVHHHNHEE